MQDVFDISCSQRGSGMSGFRNVGVPAVAVGWPVVRGAGSQEEIGRSVACKARTTRPGRDRPTAPLGSQTCTRAAAQDLPLISGGSLVPGPLQDGGF